MRKIPLIATTALAALLPATAALGQAWIGALAADAGQAASVQNCLEGQPLPESELAEGRDAAQALMATYWQQAGSGDPAGIGAAFQRVGTARWVEGPTQFRRADMGRVRDALAADPGLILTPMPVSFARAGAEPMTDARGVWEVRSRTDPSVVAGHYFVTFERFMMRWGIARVELIRSPGAPAAVVPYCESPGDIEAYAVRRAEREARRAARRAAQEARQSR